MLCNILFRTPRHIIDMIVKLMKSTPEDIIVDQAAGSAGFLLSYQQYLLDYIAYIDKATHNKMKKVDLKI
ncbi:N-6 DNA methylase [Clostridium perfringens]